jgi:hypothetical protein
MRSTVCVNHRTAHLELECRLDTRSAHRHHLDTTSPNSLTLTPVHDNVQRFTLAGAAQGPLDGDPNSWDPRR